MLCLTGIPMRRILGDISKRLYSLKLNLARRSFLATSVKFGMRSLINACVGKQLLSPEVSMNIITIPLDKWSGHDPEFKYDERVGIIKYIVLHSTDGIDSRDWLSKWNRKHETEQNNVSIHYLVQRDGNVYRII